VGMLTRRGLARKLRALRESLYLSQTEFGARLEVGRVTVCRWESGVQEPGLEARRKLMDQFGADVLQDP